MASNSPSRGVFPNVNANSNEPVRERNRRLRLIRREIATQREQASRRAIRVAIIVAAAIICSFVLLRAYQDFYAEPSIWFTLASIFTLTAFAIALFEIHNSIFISAMIEVACAFVAFRSILQTAAMCANEPCQPIAILLVNVIGSLAVAASLAVSIAFLSSVSEKSVRRILVVYAARLMALVLTLVIMAFGVSIILGVGYFHNGMGLLMRQGEFDDTHAEIVAWVAWIVIAGGARSFYKLMRSLDDEQNHHS